VQRRERAQAAALHPRAELRSAGLPDWRLLAIGGALVVGLAIVAAVLLFSSGPNSNSGVQQPDDGGLHVAVGTTCRLPEAPCGPDPYSTIPAASGPHWDPSGVANWGVYASPQNESQLVHNLEHGGIVIWYDPAQVDTTGVQRLADYVDQQVASGISGRFKFILSPWDAAEPLPAPVVATAWRWMLQLQAADTAAIDEFARTHYQMSPEPNGGPAPPS
jgi:hypothetical protein